MTNRISSLLLTFLFVSVPKVAAQDTAHHPLPFDLRIGWELQRESIGGVIGYSFYQTSEWKIQAELDLAAAVAFGVSLRYVAHLSRSLDCGPEVGLLFNNPPWPPAASPLLGFVVVDHVTRGLDLSVGFRIWFVTVEPGTGVGGTLTKSLVRDLHNSPPSLLCIGVAF
jgi:hypothetical protein